MKLYRYETTDGSGPWFTRDGFVKAGPQNRESLWGKKWDDNWYLSAFTSLVELCHCFTWNKINLKNYKVKIYEVSDSDITKIRKSTEVLFPKTYCPIN